MSRSSNQIGYERKASEQTNGLRPTTSSDSKFVILTAERGDYIDITEVTNLLESNAEVPSMVSVIRRDSTYYGPKVLVRSETGSGNRHFMLSAPGPTSELILWAAEITEDDYYESWSSIAEVKASMGDQQGPLKICSECSNPIHSIEHERMAELGLCNQE